MQPADAPSLALEVRSVGHGFGGLTVLRDVNFTVGEGQIVGLIGPNGSGKSTLFNIVTGFIAPRSGKTLLRGRDLAGMNVQARSRAGLVRTFQTPKIFDHMSVLENLMVGAAKSAKSGMLENALRLPRARAELRRARETAEQIAERFGLLTLCHLPGARLASGQRRMLELARACAGSPSVLLLDEPSAGLNTEEIQQLDEKLGALNEDGMTILIVSHDMQMMERAHQVHVLYFGAIIASDSMRGLQENARVKEVYLGM